MRQRKDETAAGGYSRAKMSTLQITPATTADEVLRAQPNTAPVFIKYRTDCVGCRMTRFCTLSEVAKTYQIDLQSLLEDLEKVAASSDTERSESKDSSPDFQSD